MNLKSHIPTNTPSLIPAALLPNSCRHLGRLSPGGFWGKLLALHCCITLPVAADEFEDFTYTDNGTTITIDGYSGNGGAVSIPASIVGKPVTVIGDDAFSFADLTSVTIPSSVVHIGEFAFSSTNLTSVTIPLSVSSLGKSPFGACASLASIAVDPGNPNFSSSGGVLFNKLQTALIQFPGGLGGSYAIPANVTSIQEWAFDGCGLTSVTIPSSVTSLGNATFLACHSLTSVTIPSSVTSIGNSAFLACESLSNVTIGSSVASIGDNAFSFCSSLTSVTIPAMVTSIGDYAFSDCVTLTNATFLGNAPAMGEEVFGYAASGITVYYSSGASGFTSPTWLGYTSVAGSLEPAPEIELNDSNGNLLVDGSSVVAFESPTAGSLVVKTLTIRNIGQEPLTGIALSKGGTDAGAFILGTLGANFLAAGDSMTFDISCTPQDGLAFTATLNIASDDADEDPFDIGLTAYIAEEPGDFSYTDNGTSITIDGYTGIGGAVNIPAAINGKPVTVIGAYAFDSSSLTSVTIPSSVISIEDGAFGFCRELSNVTIPSSVASIGNGTFTSCDELVAIAVDPGNPNFNSIGGVLFNELHTTLIQFPGGLGGAYAIPAGVTTIQDRAFSRCEGLTSVSIPSSVTDLGDWTFVECTGLTSVIIPSSVTNIGENVFSGCYAMISVTIPPSVTTIGAEAFSGCESITTVTIPPGVTSLGYGVFSNCRSLTNIAIPAGVTSIGDYAFNYCNLTSITIPSGVTSIGERAFYFCDLTSVTIPSLVTSIGDAAFSRCDKLTSATFFGTAPSMGSLVFEEAGENFTIYYSGSTSGFTSPTWLGYPAVDLFVPEITVELPSTPALVDGSSMVVFQSTSAGSAVIKTFTIRNDGQQPLTGLALSKEESHPGAFTLGSLGETSLGVGASMTFDVTCTPQAGASKTAILRIASNDANENPFDIALSASVVAINSDDFNDNSKNIAKWGTDMIFGSGGSLAETNSRLQYTSITASGDHVTHRPWILTAATYDTHWELVLDVSNSVRWVSGSGFRNAAIGVEIFPAGTTSLSFLTELNSSKWGSNSYDSFQGFMSGKGEEFSLQYSKIPSAGTNGSIRVAFNSATKVISTYFDTDGSANGYLWIPLATIGISGSGGETNANWNMSDSQAFQVAIYGTADSSIVTSGQLLADNFSITTQVSGPPPASPVQSWQIAKFGSASAPEAALDFDADEDSLPNLLEYAFKLEPEIPGTPILTTVTGTSGLPRITLIGTGPAQRLRVEYVRMKASSNPGINYVPQFSSSLQGGETGGWTAASSPEIKESISPDWERVVIEDTTGTGQAKRFGRVWVTAP